MRYGVVGLGHMGRYHVNVLGSIPEISFVGVFDSDTARAAEMAERYKVRSFPTFEAMLDEVDAVSICVPTSLHHGVALKALAKGRHVLVEKPMTDQPAHAVELVETAREKGLLLQVGHVERFNGAVQELQHIVKDPSLWESRRMGPNTGRILDTGVVMDLMIHDLDICLRTVGSKVVSVHGSGFHLPGSKHEDAASALVHFENGLTATFTASRVTQEKIRTLAVSQKDSYLTLDFTTQDLQIHRQATSATQTTAEQIRYRQESLVERVFVHKDNPLRSEIQHFARTAATLPGAAPAAYQENLIDLETLRVADTIRRQIAESRPG